MWELHKNLWKTDAWEKAKNIIFQFLNKFTFYKGFIKTSIYLL